MGGGGGGGGGEGATRGKRLEDETSCYQFSHTPKNFVVPIDFGVYAYYQKVLLSFSEKALFCDIAASFETVGRVQVDILHFFNAPSCPFWVPHIRHCSFWRLIIFNPWNKFKL